jgi:hypothetical protein
MRGKPHQNALAESRDSAAQADAATPPSCNRPAAPADAFPLDSLTFGLAPAAGGGALELSCPKDAAAAQQYCFAVSARCGSLSSLIY